MKRKEVKHDSEGNWLMIDWKKSGWILKGRRVGKGKTFRDTAKGPRQTHEGLIGNLV